MPGTRLTGTAVTPGAVVLGFSKTTWGTVTAVEMVVTVLDPGMTLPEVEQGTVIVVLYSIVVTGTATGGVTGASPVFEGPPVVATGVGGASVTVLGQLVMIPGFWGMNCAQIPARYDKADCTSSSEPQAVTQSMTSLVKSTFLQ